MKAKLIRHSLLDRPDWIIIQETVPLGTEYEVLGYEHSMILISPIGERKSVSCFLLKGNGGFGFLPTQCFEIIMEKIVIKEKVTKYDKS